MLAAATPPNQPQRRILTDYFNNYNLQQLNIGYLAITLLSV
jgi:hypothetical protein